MLISEAGWRSFGVYVTNGDHRVIFMRPAAAHWFGHGWAARCMQKIAKLDRCSFEARNLGWTVLSYPVSRAVSVKALRRARESMLNLLIQIRDEVCADV